MTLFTLYAYIFHILVYIEIEPMKSFKIQLFECTYACRAYWNRFKLLTKRSSFDKIVCVRLCVCELSIIGNRYPATSNRCVVVLYDMCLLCICYPFSCVHAVYIQKTSGCEYVLRQCLLDELVKYILSIHIRTNIHRRHLFVS